MRINVRVLGWQDKCCGCNKEIPRTDKVFIISDIVAVCINGPIHLCEKCIDEIIKSKEEDK